MERNTGIEPASLAWEANALTDVLIPLKLYVTPLGIEPRTGGLGNHSSIQLRYGACISIISFQGLIP